MDCQVKNIELNDLEKFELIKLLGLHAPCLRDRDIVRVRYDTMMQKSQDLMDEAARNMKALSQDRPEDVIRQVDMSKVVESFMQSINRTVNRTFADVRLDNRFYRVDPKLRGDRVQVKYDPFSSFDTVQIYSLEGHYLGTATLYDRTDPVPAGPQQTTKKPKHSYTDLLLRQHKQMLAEQTGGIDYRKIVDRRSWPFHEFAKSVAQLMGKKAALAELSAGELESLKKVYNQSTATYIPHPF